MARPKSPDGRHVTLATRVTEATAEAVDARRGEATRSEWLEALVYAALGGVVKPAATTVASSRPSSAAVPAKRAAGRARRPEAPAAARAVPFREPVATGGAGAARKACRHPNMRISKGVCPDCQEWVVKS